MSYRSYMQLIYDINSDKLTKEEVIKAMKQIAKQKREEREKYLAKLATKSAGVGYEMFSKIVLKNNHDLRFFSCENCIHFRHRQSRISTVDDEKFANYLIYYYYLKSNRKIPSSLLSIIRSGYYDLTKIEKIVKETLPQKLADDLLRELKEQFPWCSKLNSIVLPELMLPIGMCPSRNWEGCPFFVPKVTIYTSTKGRGTSVIF